MGKRKETSGFTEVHPEHVAEFIEMGEKARNPKARGRWLQARLRYRFPKATKEQRLRIAFIVDAFRRLGTT